MACLCALRLHFLWLTMRSTVSAPDKWLISSWSEPPPSDACLLCIVAVVMNRWPTRLGRGGEVINQSHQKAICSAVRILRGRTPLQPGVFWAEYVMNDQKCRREKWETQCWTLQFEQRHLGVGIHTNLALTFTLQYFWKIQSPALENKQHQIYWHHTVLCWHIQEKGVNTIVWLVHTLVSTNVCLKLHYGQRLNLISLLT